DKNELVDFVDFYMIVKCYFNDLHLVYADIDRHAKVFIELMYLQVISNTMFPSASVQVKKGYEVIHNSADGTGPIDALYSAILEVTDMDINLLEYKISSVTRGKEALGKVKVSAEYEGITYYA